MVTIPAAATHIRIPIRHLYTITAPFNMSIAEHNAWTKTMSQACFGVVRANRVMKYLCTQNGFVSCQLGTGAPTGNSYDSGLFVRRPGGLNFDLVYMEGTTTGDPDWYRSCVKSVEIGENNLGSMPLRQISTPDASNDNNGCGPWPRLGRKQLTMIRTPLFSDNKLLYYSNLDSDGVTIDSSIDLASIMPNNGSDRNSAILTHQNGYRLWRISPTTPSTRQLLTFFPNGSAVEDTWTLNGVTFNTNTDLFGSGSGIVLVDNAATPIFPGMNGRVYFVSGTFDAWYNVEIVPTDTISEGVIAAAASYLYSADDGYFYAKSNVGAVHTICSSLSPPKQVLPHLVPMGGLPDYGIYDKPYGVRR